MKPSMEILLEATFTHCHCLIYHLISSSILYQFLLHCQQYQHSFFFAVSTPLHMAVSTHPSLVVSTRPFFKVSTRPFLRSVNTPNFTHVNTLMLVVSVLLFKKLLTRRFSVVLTCPFFLFKIQTCNKWIRGYATKTSFLHFPFS